MISVCLASYNGENYIKIQIDSILKQLSLKDELLISDDGSTDATLKILNKYSNDSRVKIFQNSFKSHIKNFEFLLNTAKGDYIFMSDQDDIWVDNKVEITLKYLKKYDLILSDCILIDGYGQIIKDSQFGNNIPKTGFINTFHKNIYTGCCMAFTQKIRLMSVPFPKKINSHDMWIGMVAELNGSVKVIGDKLIYFRRHGKNFSASISEDTFLSGKSPFKKNKIIKHRAYMLLNLIRNYIRNVSRKI